MFSYHDERCDQFQNDESDMHLFINDIEFDVKKSVCQILSKRINERLQCQSPIYKKEFTFMIEKFDARKYYEEITNIFNGYQVNIDKNNIQSLMKLSSFFEMEALSFYLSDLIFDENIIQQFFFHNSDLAYFFDLEETILEISDNEKFSKCIIGCLSIIEKIGKPAFLELFLNICSKTAFLSITQIKRFIEVLQDEKLNIIEDIMQIFNKNQSQNENENKIFIFLFHELYKDKYLSKNDLFKLFNDKYPFIFIDIFGEDLYELRNYHLCENEALAIKEGNFEIHCKSILEGHSQDPILCSIRNDDIDELLLLLSSSTTFEGNQKILKNEYEKIPLLNDNACTLIDYSAFFGSIKCFNYLIINEPNYNHQKSLRFAIAGGQKKIILSLLNMGISLKNSCCIAAEFHQHELLEWLFVNKYDEYNYNIMLQIIKNLNFKSLFSLIKEGFFLFDCFLSSIICNNILLLKISLDIMSLLHKENYINLKKCNIFLYLFMIFNSNI